LKPTGTRSPFRTDHAVKDRSKSGVTKEKNIFAYVPLRWRSTNSLPRRVLYPPSRPSRAMIPGSSLRTLTIGGSYRSGTRIAAPAIRAPTMPNPNRARDAAAVRFVPRGGRSSGAARLGRVPEKGMARAAPAGAKIPGKNATATVKPARLPMERGEKGKLRDLPQRNDQNAL